MSATILLSIMAASMAVPQSSTVFADAALAPRNSDGIAIVKLFVAPDREVLACRVVASGLSEADNDRVCDKLVGKRAGEAARGPDGQAAYGTMTYVVAGSGTRGSAELEANLPADITLDVKSLPGGAKSTSVNLNLLLDASGKVAKCEGSRYSSDSYVTAACASLKDQVLDVRKGSDGNPVSYVDSVNVDFVSRQAGL